MRIFFAVLLVFFVLPCMAQAQTSQDERERRYYNSQGQYNAQIFNAPGTSSRGPLSLRQILQGRENAADGTKAAYYGGYNNRPYGVDNNSYSLALSPDEIRATRARRDAFARQRERESIDSLSQQANALYIEDETDAYLDTFQSSPNVRRRVKKKKKTEGDDKGFKIPPKVFNSIY